MNAQTLSDVFSWASVIVPLLVGLIGLVIKAPRIAVVGSFVIAVIGGLGLHYRNVVSAEKDQTIDQLRLQSANRDISEIDGLTEKLSAFAGQPAKIVVYPVHFESVWMATKIYGALLNAHWKVEFPERLLTAPGNGFMVQGIWVDRSNDDASKRAAKALFSALGPSSAVGGMGDDGVSATQAFDVNKPLVWIMIGDKPAPLRSWLTPKRD